MKLCSLQPQVLLQGQSVLALPAPSAPGKGITPRSQGGRGDTRGFLASPKHRNCLEIFLIPPDQSLTKGRGHALRHLRGSGSVGTGYGRTGCAGCPEKMREGKEVESSSRVDHSSSLVGNSPEENFGGYGLPSRKFQGFWLI